MLLIDLCRLFLLVDRSVEAEFGSAVQLMFFFGTLHAVLAMVGEFQFTFPIVAEAVLGDAMAGDVLKCFDGTVFRERLVVLVASACVRERSTM